MQKLFLILILLFSIINFAFSQTPNNDSNNRIYEGLPHSLLIHGSQEEVVALKSRWQAIADELKNTENMFAGTYFKNGYRGWYLRWSPKNGFVYIYHYEHIDTIDYSYGRVEFKDSEIIFIPERDLNKTIDNKPLLLPRTWIPLGNYFIPKEELENFGNYYAGFGIYNDFNGACCEFSPFFFKNGVAKKLLSNFNSPNYGMFLKEPIKTEITSIGKSKKTTKYSIEGTLYSQSYPNAVLTTVKINAGIQQNVKKNMLFRIMGKSEDSNELPYLQITKVRSNESVGIIVNATDENWNERVSIPIYVGMKVTTSPISDN